MTIVKATYGRDPSANDKDHVRFLIGDTIPEDWLFSDAEILGLLSQYGNVKSASLVAVESLVARFSRLCDEEVGDVKVKLSQKVNSYIRLAKRLKQQIASECAMPYAGGISVADKEATALDLDRVEPCFDRDLHNNPRKSDRSDFKI